MAGPQQLGLRTQLVLALGAVFVLSFALLSTVALQLTRRSVALERAQDGMRFARLLASQLADGGPAEDSPQGVLARAHRHLGLRAVELRRPGAPAIRVGALPSQAGARVALPGGGGTLTVWPDGGQVGDSPFGRLLLFYVALTLVAALLLSVVLLTFMTVRPLEAVTRASERLAAGDLSTQVPVSGAAEVVGLSTSLNRMAAQLRAEREALQRRVQQLQTTTDELVATQKQLVHGERLASVGRLAAGIAHEIGNPLSGILGLVELLEGGTLAAEQTREFLARIHAETERINGIIRELLDFARRDPDHGEAATEVVVRDVVQDAVALVLHRAGTADVRIENRLGEGLPTVRVGRGRLMQVFLNLLLNALDALGGRGTIGVEGALAETGDALIVHVSDDGPGVSPEIAEHLFEPFSTTKPVGQGTGLGLAVAHALIERMGGELALDADFQGGARFVVRIPTCAARAAP